MHVKHKHQFFFFSCSCTLKLCVIYCACTIFSCNTRVFICAYSCLHHLCVANGNQACCCFLCIQSGCIFVLAEVFCRMPNAKHRMTLKVVGLGLGIRRSAKYPGCRICCKLNVSLFEGVRCIYQLVLKLATTTLLSADQVFSSKNWISTISTR